MPKSRPLKELHVDWKFTEGRSIGKKELHRHCEEVSGSTRLGATCILQKKKGGAKHCRLGT